MTAIGLLALLAVSFGMISYLGAQSRELDQLIALEDRAEQLREHYPAKALVRDNVIRALNRTMLKIAHKRRELVRARRLRATDLNRLVVARRRGMQA